MGRFPQHQAKNGSQRWIQRLVNDKPEILDSQIWSKLKFSVDEDIRWLSPLKSDGYAEYRDQSFLKLLGVNLRKMSLAQFWPNGGPQWDALGKSSSGKLFLVEGKSHITELMSNMQAKDERSRTLIRKGLDDTKHYLNSKTEGDWSQCFYQYANRLAHLCLLRKNGLPAYLIHVYFLNDFEMDGPDSIQEWKGAIKLLESYLGVRRHRLQKFMAEVYTDVGRL
jgi:hypothetical protein